MNCIISCVIVLFCVALSDNWTSRTSAVIGLMFTLFSLLFIGSSLAILFAWDLNSMELPKRCIFVLLFLMTSLISGVMFLLAPASCDQFNQYGCFQTYYSSTFKVASAFSFISVLFAVGDVVMNFVFHFRTRKPEDLMKATSTTSRICQVSVLGTENPCDELSTRKGRSTYV
uniref:MARVEL domain-containing protein n=1 Tax=Heterorhabditis bacteriophora TaxID=37862 RepID=A0A1I7XPF3_HETBA